MFEHCKTAEELKKEYHKAAIRLHPDNGGSEDAFKEMQVDFTRMFDRLKNIHVNSKGEMYEKTGEYATTETAQEFMDILASLMSIDSIQIEICGSWLWIGGDTKPAKESLKEVGCRWSQNKKMWYFDREDGVRRYHKKPWTMAEIRGAYGSQKVRKEVKVGIEAEAV